jgi:CPA2 family monovalent cation:H+ antiporter-2
MENIDLLITLAFTMGAALIGGFVAQRLRQPVILGYLVGGIMVGPYTPGLVSDIHQVQTLANVGVTLLMFALGVEFSLEALQRVRRVAIFGGMLQILLTLSFGALLGTVLGYSLESSIFLGGIIAISSSILMLKLLLARNEVESLTGRVALGIGIVQDLAMVPLIILLPAIGAGLDFDSLMGAGLALAKGLGFLVLAYVLGSRLVPPLLGLVARAGSRELFLLCIVAIAAGTAMLGQLVGTSFALGAFLAGMVVAASEFSTEVVDEIVPVRDIFATLFFVSIGMLMQPSYLLSHALEVGLLVVSILIGKFLIAAAIVKMFGYPAGVATRAGLLLAQIGEFSFVLAGVGLARNVIEDDLYNLVLAGALVTLVLNPALVNNADRITDVMKHVMVRVGRFFPERVRRTWVFNPAGTLELPNEDQRLAALKRHVIICGYGRVGQEIARALQRRGFAFAVIDYTPARVEDARHDGCLAIQGDSTNPLVLEHASIASARMVAVTLPDLPSAEQVVRIAKELNPKVRVLARTHDARTIPHLRAAGADEVIQPEFEAGLEMVRQALRNYGVSSLETQTLLGGRRQEHYDGARERGPSEESLWS